MSSQYSGIYCVVLFLDAANNSVGLIPWGITFGKSTTYRYLRDNGQWSGYLRPRTIITILLLLRRKHVQTTLSHLRWRKVYMGSRLSFRMWWECTGGAPFFSFSAFSPLSLFLFFCFSWLPVWEEVEHERNALLKEVTFGKPSTRNDFFFYFCFCFFQHQWKTFVLRRWPIFSSSSDANTYIFSCIVNVL